jgi:hypothetical protein
MGSLKYKEEYSTGRWNKRGWSHSDKTALQECTSPSASSRLILCPNMTTPAPRKIFQNAGLSKFSYNRKHNIRGRYRKKTQLECRDVNKIGSDHTRRDSCILWVVQQWNECERWKYWQSKQLAPLKPIQNTKTVELNNACQKIKCNTRATALESTIEGTLEMCNKGE